MSYLSRDGHARSNDIKSNVKKIVDELKHRIITLVSSNDDKQEIENNESTSKGKRKKKLKGEIKKKRRVSLHVSESLSLASEEDREYALMINLKRLRTLVKQFDVLTFFGDDEGAEIFTARLASNLSTKLNQRKHDKSLFNENSKVHAVVAESIHEGLSVMLTLAAWRLRLLQKEEKILLEKEDILGLGKDELAEDEINEPHFVVNLRNRIISVVELCFEQFLMHENTGEEMSLDKFPEAMVKFANSAQVIAGKIASDLRILFPKIWQKAASPLLRSLALTEDGKLIGGFVRHFRSQEDTVSLFAVFTLILYVKSLIFFSLLPPSYV